LRRFDESRQHLENVLTQQLRLYKIDSSNIGDINSLADAYLELGWTESEAGNHRKAIDQLGNAIVHYETVAAKDPNNISARRQISFTKRHIGEAFLRRGDRRRAYDHFAVALRQSEELVRSDPENTEFRYDKAICLSRLGEFFPAEKDLLPEAERILSELIAESPERLSWSNDLEHLRKRSATAQPS
jgi:tetratricopeptide (TPR) repeat protein